MHLARGTSYTQPANNNAPGVSHVFDREYQSFDRLINEHRTHDHSAYIPSRLHHRSLEYAYARTRCAPMDLLDPGVRHRILLPL